MKKILRPFIILVLLGFLLQNKTHAQQDAMFTQYMFNTLSVNSAYAGTKDALNIIGVSRHQWVGFDGAPVTQSLTMHAPIKKQRLGIGGSYVRDEIGPLVVNNFFIDVSYQIKLHEGGRLAMGVKAGFDARKADLSTLNPIDPSDPSALTNSVSDLTPNFGAGLFYYTDNYYLGLSTPKILQSENTDPALEVPGDVLARHYFIIGGYVWDINEEFKFKPTFFTKLVKSAPASVDLTTSVMYKERFIAGFSYRFGDSFGAMVQIGILHQLWLGYAYDYTLSNLGNFSSGTHEIMLTLDLSMPKSDIIKSPRFF